MDTPGPGHALTDTPGHASTESGPQFQANVLDLMDWTMFEQGGQMKRAIQYLKPGEEKCLVLKDEHCFGKDFSSWDPDWVAVCFHGTTWENACQILRMKKFQETEQRHERMTMTVRHRPLVGVYVGKTMVLAKRYAFDNKPTAFGNVGVVFHLHTAAPGTDPHVPGPHNERQARLWQNKETNDKKQYAFQADTIRAFAITVVHREPQGKETKWELR